MANIKKGMPAYDKGQQLWMSDISDEVGKSGVYAKVVDIASRRERVIGIAIPLEITGEIVRRWVNDLTGINDKEFSIGGLTNGPINGQPGIYYNILFEQTVYLSQICCQITSPNGGARFELGYTDQQDGGGKFTPVTPIYRIKTGEIFGLPMIQTFSPPITILGGQAQSTTARVKTDAIGDKIMVAWTGWFEGEEEE